MKGTFYVIGVGPGDPELLTLRAARTLEKCQVWLTPAARKNGESTALAIASGAVSVAGKEILTHHFPMKKVHMGETPDPEVKEAWEQVVALITTELKAGRDVAMPTLGDPAVYSTGFYVCQTLLEQNPPRPLLRSCRAFPPLVPLRLQPGCPSVWATISWR